MERENQQENVHEQMEKEAEERRPKERGKAKQPLYNPPGRTTEGPPPGGKGAQQSATAARTVWLPRGFPGEPRLRSWQNVVRTAYAQSVRVDALRVVRTAYAQSVRVSQHAGA